MIYLGDQITISPELLAYAERYKDKENEKKKKEKENSVNWLHYYDATSVSTCDGPTVRGGGIKPLFCLTSYLTSLIKAKKWG